MEIYYQSSLVLLLDKGRNHKSTMSQSPALLKSLSSICELTWHSSNIYILWICDTIIWISCPVHSYNHSMWVEQNQSKASRKSSVWSRRGEIQWGGSRVQSKRSWSGEQPEMAAQNLLKLWIECWITFYSQIQLISQILGTWIVNSSKHYDVWPTSTWHALH